jgi:hypothetical protein
MHIVELDGLQAPVGTTLESAAQLAINQGAGRRSRNL